MVFCVQTALVPAGFHAEFFENEQITRKTFYICATAERAEISKTEMTQTRIMQFPASRIATIDMGRVARNKHHVSALIELDVTNSRAKLKQRNKNAEDKISFTAWLVAVIGRTLQQYETAASYRSGKTTQTIFSDINVSMVVEKKLNDHKVPIPLIIEKAQERSVTSITQQIAAARETPLSEKEMVLHQKTNRLERLYYKLPAFARRAVWRYLLSHPKLAYSKMGNVAVTSVGMIGQINGWFIPSSVHPICFGIGAITRKPAVAGNQIAIREMLHMTILFDHDVMDGAPMTRLLNSLSKAIEGGSLLTDQ